MYLTEMRPIPLATGLDLFRLQPLESEPCDHASRKASICPQEALESEEEEI